MAPLTHNGEEEKSTIENPVRHVHELPEYQRLLAQTEEDVQAMINGVTTYTEEILYPDLPIEERLRRFGRMLNCTLLAQEHRGGYLVNTGTQQLLGHLEETFGVRGSEIAMALGYPSFENFLRSEGMAEYVQLTYNDAKQVIYKGRPFQNKFLSELLVAQETGQSKVDKKELDKQLDRAARLQANKMTPESIDARIRIYTCMNNIGATKRLKAYQDVQAEYLRVYQKMLNKTELKSVFGIGEAFNVLRECCFNDIHVQEDEHKSGFLYVMLKRPLEEIIEEYENLKDEVANNPVDQNIKKLQQYHYDYLNRGRERPPKKKGGRQTPDPPGNVDLNADHLKTSFAFDAKKTKPEGLSALASSTAAGPSEVLTEAPKTKKPQSRTTGRGEGTYSDEDDSDDPFARPTSSLSPLKMKFPPKKVEVKTQQMVKLHQRSNLNESLNTEDEDANKKSKQSGNSGSIPQPPKAPQEPKRVEEPRELNGQGPSGLQAANLRQKTPPSPLAPEISALIHAFISGYLSSIFPGLYSPTKAVLIKTKAYLKKKNIEVTMSQLKQFLMNEMADDLVFRADHFFVGLVGSQ